MRARFVSQHRRGREEKKKDLQRFSGRSFIIDGENCQRETSHINTAITWNACLGVISTVFAGIARGGGTLRRRCLLHEHSLNVTTDLSWAAPGFYLLMSSPLVHQIIYCNCMLTCNILETAPPPGQDWYFFLQLCWCFQCSVLSLCQ